MSKTVNNVRISLRKDDLSNWISCDPVLKNGEIAIATDADGNEFIKVGNGLSSFSQLDFINQRVVKTETVQTNFVKAKTVSQGYNVNSTNTSMATGVFADADGNFQVAHGIEVRALSDDSYAFIWNGKERKSAADRYETHGAGTFNVNPAGGISGFYIGEDTLNLILREYLLSNEISNYYLKSETSSSSEISTALEAKIKVGLYSNEEYSLSSSQLSVVKIAADDYYQMLSEEKQDDNVLYVVSSDNINALGERILNVADPELSDDAANKKYVDDSIGGVPLSDYYLKSETSSAADLDTKFNLLSTYNQTKAQLSNDGYALTSHIPRGTVKTLSCDNIVLSADSDGNVNLSPMFSGTNTQNNLDNVRTSSSVQASAKSYIDGQSKYPIIETTTGALLDRTINTADASVSAFALPDAPSSGAARDLVLVIDLTSALSASAIAIDPPSGETITPHPDATDTLTFEAGKINILSMTEIMAHNFLYARKAVT